MPKEPLTKQGRSRITADNLTAEIARISHLSIKDLRALWHYRYDRDPASALTKDLLARALCHAIQEEVLGSLRAGLRKSLSAIAIKGSIVPAAGRHLKPGSILIREYQAVVHQVVVIPDGFLWQEQTYASLSAIARKITGTTWNGKRFFGVNEASEKEKQERNVKATPPTHKDAPSGLSTVDTRFLAPHPKRIEEFGP